MMQIRENDMCDLYHRGLSDLSDVHPSMAPQVENGEVQGSCLCGWTVRHLGAHGLHTAQAGA